MSMPFEPTFCTYCGGHRDDVGPLSTRGRCYSCSDRAMLSAIRQMRAREGPVYEWWIERLTGTMVGKALERGLLEPPSDDR